MGYLDSKIGNITKYLALVPPAAPVRHVDLGTITTGLNFAPGNAGQVGVATFDPPRWAQTYKNILIRVRGTIGGGAAAGGGAIRQNWRMYRLINRIECILNGTDTFINIEGDTLKMMNLLWGEYRNTENLGQDTIPTAPGAGATVAFDFTYKLNFHDPLLYPRLFNMLNAYEGHGCTSFQLRLTLGSLADLLTGDAGAVLVITDVQVSATVMDYTMLPGFGIPYVVETEFARQEMHEQNGITLANATDQRIKLNRGLYYSKLMLFDMDATGATANANNITQLSVKRDTIDDWVRNVRVPHLQRMISDRYSNCFTGGTGITSQNHVYVVDFTPDFEITQLVNTYNMTDWDLFVNSGAAGRLKVVEIKQNIPTAFIRRKDSTATMMTKGKSY